MKKHPFWIRGSQVMPQNTQISLVWSKMGFTHNFTRNDILSYVSTFYGLRTSKQYDLHLQTSLLGAWFRSVPAWALGAPTQVHLEPQSSTGAPASPNFAGVWVRS